MSHSFFYLFHGLLVHLKCSVQRRGGSIISFYISRDWEKESWSEFFKVSWRLVADRQAECRSEIPTGFNRHLGMLPLSWENKRILSSEIYYLSHLYANVTVCICQVHTGTHICWLCDVQFLSYRNYFLKSWKFLSHSSSAPAHWKGLDSISSHSCVIITTVRRFWIINAVLYQLKTFSFCTDTDSSIKPHGMLTSHLSDVAHWHLQCRER